MNDGIAARPLPHHSIIKEVMEGEEGWEVKEETQLDMQAQGTAEKMCYDATHRISIVR